MILISPINMNIAKVQYTQAHLIKFICNLIYLDFNSLHKIA